MTRAHTPTPRLRAIRPGRMVSSKAVAKGHPMYLGSKDGAYGFLWRGDRDYLAGSPWTDMVCLGVEAKEAE